MFASDSPAHDDDEEGNGDGKNLSHDEIAEGRGGRGKRNGVGLRSLPGSSKEDDDKVGEHFEEIAPTGSADRSAQGDEVVGVGENGGQENESKDEREGAEPGGCVAAGASKEGEGEDQVPDNVEREDLAEDGRLVGLPAGGRVEEIEVDGDSNDGDLEEVQEAKGVDGGGAVVGPGEEDHEHRGGPDEIEDVRGPGAVSGVGDKVLIIGADGLSQRFESEGQSEKKPDLARVSGRAPSHEEAAKSGEKGHYEIEGIGDEEFGNSGANEFKVKEEQQRQEESDRDGETSELAGRKQDDLTGGTKRLERAKCTTEEGYQISDIRRREVAKGTNKS